MATINSGITVRLLPRTQFSVPALSTTGTVTFPIASHVPVTPFTEANMLCRLHAGGFATGQQAAFNGQIDGYDFDDPATVFTVGNPSSSILSATFTNSNTAPTLLTAVATSGLTRYLNFQIVVAQPSGGATINFTASMDLILKGGDPSALEMFPNGFRGYRIG